MGTPPTPPQHPNTTCPQRRPSRQRDNRNGQHSRARCGPRPNARGHIRAAEGVREKKVLARVSVPGTSWARNTAQNEQPQRRAQGWSALPLQGCVGPHRAIPPAPQPTASTKTQQQPSTSTIYVRTNWGICTGGARRTAANKVLTRQSAQLHATPAAKAASMSSAAGGASSPPADGSACTAASTARRTSEKRFHATASPNRRRPPRMTMK